VKVTDEHAAWFTALIKQDLDSATQVAQAVAALREEGPTPGRPLADRLKASAAAPGRRQGGELGTLVPRNIPVAEQLCIDYTADEEE
jgi:hypothetical protein